MRSYYNVTGGFNKISPGRSLVISFIVIICLFSDEMSSEVSAHKVKNNHKLKLKN
jgi:hypothetical protein